MFRKISMLAVATAIVGTAGAAHAADNAYGAAQINGNGASSIANVLVQELNCFGGPNNPLGKTTGTTAIPDHLYQPTAPSTGNPVYDCATKSVQDLIDGKYVSTGSGGGRNSWKNLNTSGISSNPFGSWSRIQYAFSDSAISSAELATYNSTAAPAAGPAIQIPMFILPVAVAYSPTYGKILTGTGVVSLKLNVKTPRADGSGGLRLKRATYCKIMNGEITNWNDAALKADNGNLSLMDVNDDATRWNATGVPIKLVGRSENSGTTNIFVRHLGTVCGGLVTTNKFGDGNDQLPATAKGTAVYDKTTGQLTSGTETSTLFGLADGSDGVAHAIGASFPDPTTLGQVTLNGRIGYVGADWVAPSTLSGSTLHSADLQVALTSGFAAPTAVNATKSFKGIYAPQSDTTGKYNPSSTAAGRMAGLRSNPLAWVFPNTKTYTDASGATVTNPLAAPAAGYPIVGTTNMLMYTCYANADVRKAMHGFALLHLGKVTVADDLTKVPAKLVSSPAKDSAGLPIGILSRNGIAPLPGYWVTSLYETFFSKTTTGNNPSSLGLWIQDKQQVKGAPVPTAVLANPACGSLAGA